MKRKALLTFILSLIAVLLIAVTGCAVKKGESDDKFIVRFYSDGQEVVATQNEYSPNDKIIFPEAPSKQPADGYIYEFKGWSETENGEIVDEDNCIADGNKNYYAVYEQKSDTFFTVTFKDEITDETLKAQEVRRGENATPPDEPEHDGYTFSHWEGDYNNVRHSFTVWARFDINSYTVTKHGFFGSESATVEFKGAVDLTVPESGEEAFEFVGWYSDAALTQPVGEGYTMPAGNVDLYAKYDFDFTGVALNASSDSFVYGETNTVSVVNLAEKDGVSFAYDWGELNGGQSVELRNAGSYAVNVVITATFGYDGVELNSVKALSGHYNVAKAALTLELEMPENLTYGTAPAPAATFTGYKYDDAEEINPAVQYEYKKDGQAANADKLEVGNYSVTASCELDNYTVTPVTKNFAVEPKQITVTVTAEDFNYGEEAQALVIKDDGFVYEEDEQAISTSISYTRDGKPFTPESGKLYPAGSYEITVSDNHSGNYTFGNATAQFTVNKVKLTITAKLDESYVYGEEIQPELTFAGFVQNGGKAETEADLTAPEAKFTYTKGGEPYADSRFAVGNYTLTIGQYSSENYDITNAAPVEFAVTPKDITLTVTLANTSLTYGVAPAATAQFGQFAYSDSESAIHYNIVYKTYNDKTEGDAVEVSKLVVGDYFATATATAENYNVTVTGTPFKVTRARLTVNVTTDSESYVYGKNPVVSAAFVGLVNGDKEEIFTGKRIVYSKAGQSDINADKPLAVGDYTVTLEGVENANYEVTVNGASFTVNAKEFIITKPAEILTTAHGETWSFAPAFDGEDAKLFKFNGTVKLLNTEEGAHKATDEDTFGQNFIWEGGNFTITLADGGDDVTSNFTVKYNLTVTIANYNVVIPEITELTYDGDKHEFKVTATYGDNLSAKVQYKTDGAGEYSDTVPAFTDADVYTVNYKITADGRDGMEDSFTVTINKAEYAVTVTENQEYTYSGEQQGDPVTVKGVKEESVVGADVTYESENNGYRFIDAGEHTVNYTVAGTKNYNEKKGAFKVNVLQKTVTVSVAEASYTKNYDGKAFELVAPAVSGVLPQDMEANKLGAAVITLKEGGVQSEIKNAGEYTVTYTLTLDGNYTCDTLTYSYTVKVETLKVTVTVAGDYSKTYDGAVYELPAPQVTGILDCDKADNKLSEAAVTLETQSFQGEIKNAGEYTVTYTLTINSNYTSEKTSYSYTVTINKAEYEVSGDGQQDYTYNGAKQGENNISVVGVNGEEVDGATVTINGDYQFVNAGGHEVSYTVAATTNYNEKTGTFTVNIDKAKAVYEKEAPSFTEKMLPGKKLSSITLSDNLNWKDGEKEIELGENTYAAYYNPDTANYTDSDEISITVTGVKTQVKAEAKEVSGKLGEVAAANITASYSDYDGGSAITAETLNGKISCTVSTNANYTVGGTYYADYTVKCTANDYFELVNAEGAVQEQVTLTGGVVKITSAEVNGVWYTIEDALHTAESGTITVKGNTSFADSATKAKLGVYSDDSYYTVKANVTLLLPYDTTQDTARGVGASGATNEIPGFNGTTHKDSTTWTHSSINDVALKDLELNIPDNLKLINNGNLNIGGITTGSNGGSYPAGQTCSGYTQITLGKGVVITSTGNIVSRGFIKEKDKDNGSKLIINAGTLNIPFVVIEHRGGTKFSNIYDNMLGAPFNRFYLQNVTCEYEVHDKASVLGHANMYASGGDNSTDVKFIGGEQHFIQLQSGSYIKAKYDISTQVTQWNVYGSININALSLSISIATLSTNGIMFPLSWYHNFYFHTIDNTPATVDAIAQDMKILPGGLISVDENVTFKINKLFVYDKDFKDPASSTGDVAAPYYESNKGEGKLIVNGTLEAQELGGYVQTTVDGAKLKITTAKVCSYELVNAANLAWKSYIKNTTGMIWNNNNTLSKNAQIIGNGEYTSKNGGWITEDSQFTLEFEYGYQDENGGSSVTPEGVSPNANNPAYFTMNGLKLSPASLDGYEFVGWYSDSDFHTAIDEINGAEYENYLNGDVMKIYGLFKKLPADIQNYTVELFANNEGATISGQSSIKVNIRSDKLDTFDLTEYIPELANYNFVGWFKEVEGTSQVTELTAENFAENNLKLYAKWEIAKYNLTVNLSLISDVNGTIEVKVNDEVKLTVTQAGQNVIEVPFNAKVQITVTPGDDCIIDSIASIPEGYVVASGDIFNMPALAVEINVSIDEDGGWCLTEGTLILMADGTTKKIEDLQSGDMVIVFNHETGKYEVAPVLYNVHSGDSAEIASVARLKFTDGTEIGVAYKHFLYDLDLNRYVMITVENAKEYIGHRFAKISEVNGEYTTIGVTLCDVVISEENVRYYSPVSVYHTNIIAEGLLTYTTWPVLENPEGFMNYFAFDEDMKYNSEAMDADIEKYGLYTYEDFKDVLSEEAFYAGPWKYFKVAVGKGKLTWNDILCAIDWLYNSGELNPL